MDVWGDGISTVAWHYTPKELDDISNSGFQYKQIIANQPICNGKWECHSGCDEENHHMHKYCTWCQQRFDFFTPREHMPYCKYGIGLGQIHPPMDPSALYGNENGIWWIEPEEVIRSDLHFFELQKARKEKAKVVDEEIARQKQHVQQILEINERHRRELNGQGTSRVPLIESQEKLSNGKRFKRHHSV